MSDHSSTTDLLFDIAGSKHDEDLALNGGTEADRRREGPRISKKGGSEQGRTISNPQTYSTKAFCTYRSFNLTPGSANLRFSNPAAIRISSSALLLDSNRRV